MTCFICVIHLSCRVVATRWRQTPRRTAVPPAAWGATSEYQVSDWELQTPAGSLFIPAFPSTQRWPLLCSWFSLLLFGFAPCRFCSCSCMCSDSGLACLTFILPSAIPEFKPAPAQPCYIIWDISLLQPCHFCDILDCVFPCYLFPTISTLLYIYHFCDISGLCFIILATSQFCCIHLPFLLYFWTLLNPSSLPVSFVVALFEFHLYPAFCICY